MVAIEKVQNSNWTYRSNFPMMSYSIMCDGREIGYVYDLVQAQAIIANAHERQILRQQNEAILEQNKRLTAVIKKNISAAIDNSHKGDKPTW